MIRIERKVKLQFFSNKKKKAAQIIYLEQLFLVMVVIKIKRDNAQPRVHLLYVYD